MPVASLVSTWLGTQRTRNTQILRWESLAGRERLRCLRGCDFFDDCQPRHPEQAGASEAQLRRRRRTPCPRRAAGAMQGVFSALCTSHRENALQRPSRCRPHRGPSTRGRRAKRAPPTSLRMTLDWIGTLWWSGSTQPPTQGPLRLRSGQALDFARDDRTHTASPAGRQRYKSAALSLVVILQPQVGDQLFAAQMP